MKKILYIFAFAALLTACTNDKTADPISTVGEKDSLVADIDNSEFRNSLVDEEGKRFILWGVDDTIGINSTEGVVNELPSRNSPAVVDEEHVGQASASFWYGKGTVAGDIIAAYYPYEPSAVVEGTTITTTLPSTQTYSATSVFDTDVTIMTAVPDNSGNLVFKNTCAILQFQLQGTQTLRRVRLESTASALSGLGKVDASATNPIFKIELNTEHAKQTITLDLPETGLQLSADAPKSFYFVVPAGTYTDLRLTAYTLEGEAITRDITQPVVATVRHIVPLKPFVLGEIITEGAVDVAADGVSNCYMLPASEGGRYYLEPQNMEGTIKAENVAKIDVLWGDVKGIIGNTYYDAEAKRYYFTTHGGNHNGSIILSAFDSEGTVLWSWHIWVTNAETYTMTNENIQILDRNIGARYAPKSAADVAAMTSAVAASTCGFYYQFGRAIPFPGPKTMDAWWETSDYSVTNQYGYETKAFGTNTYAYVNPDHGMAFQNGFFDNITHTMASCVSSPMTLWHGNTASYLQMWAADVPARKAGGYKETWSSTEKGYQDPCPQGYRAASFSENLKCFREYNGSGTYMKYSHYCVSTKSVIVATSTPLDNYGGYHMSSSTNNQFLWLPHSGVRVSYLPSNYAYSESAKPEARSETGKFYLTGFYNHQGTLKSGSFYVTGVVDQEYTMGTNIINVWATTNCPLDSCNPFMIMTGSANAYHRVSGAQSYSMPSAMAVPMRCVKMAEPTANE